MEWYFNKEGAAAGPVGDEELSRLVRESKIGPDTLVWRAGMRDWLPYAAVVDDHGLERERLCDICSREFKPEELVSFEGRRICGECKPAFFQRVREGIGAPTESGFAGFWIRAGAKILDGVITYIVALLGVIPFAMLAVQFEGDAAILINTVAGWIVGILVNAAYATFFIGRFGATLGKMALGLRVVRPDGARVTYLRALGRHFAERISQIILEIGYLLAAFDDEKRALHDHICDTRVIHATARL